MFLISDLVALLDSYLDEKSVAKIYDAYLFGAEAHEGQERLTGEPYIYHPIAVAKILAEFKSDAATIIAALLHDVIEDTAVSKQQIAENFGENIAEIVDGVSKLEKMEFTTPAEAQAESFRKMVLAMSRDIRVILIKLADRLHNMRTLYGMRLAKRRRISKETVEVYAPMAERLGMYDLMLELEDLSFANMYPLRRRILENAVRKIRAKSKKSLENVIQNIGQNLEPLKLKVKIKYREKSLHSIYKKMRDKSLKFSEVNDIYAVRIITKTVDGCYRVLGVVHNLYRPVPGKFKDYIAIPKANGYQSLHTVLFAHKDEMIEIQIRTKDMDRVAESGIAAHWQYKSKDQTSNLKIEKAARQWMHQVLELQHVAGNSEEFLESLKVDLFSDKVYCFTPKGKIMELPRGATALDFAYAVHTDVGNKSKYAIIDGQQTPLGTSLRNGQTVSVITDDDSYPLPSWLDIVATGKARVSIKNYLRKLKTEDARSVGKKMLEQSIKARGVQVEAVSHKDWQRLLKNIKLKSMDELYKSIGLGERIAEFIVSMLLADSNVKVPGRLRTMFRKIPFLRGRTASRLHILGTEGMSVQYAKCCYPLPGDKIVGHLSSGRGVVVHKSSCNNLKNYRKHPERLVEISWAEDIVGDFNAELIVDVENKPGALAAIATKISVAKSNIDNIDIDQGAGAHNTMSILLKVKDRSHLARIKRELKKLPFVRRISKHRK